MKRLETLYRFSCTCTRCGKYEESGPISGNRKGGLEWFKSEGWMTAFNTELCPSCNEKARKEGFFHAGKEPDK